MDIHLPALPGWADVWSRPYGPVSVLRFVFAFSHTLFSPIVVSNSCSSHLGWRQLGQRLLRQRMAGLQLKQLLKNIASFRRFALYRINSGEIQIRLVKVRRDADAFFETGNALVQPPG